MNTSTIPSHNTTSNTTSTSNKQMHPNHHRHTHMAHPNPAVSLKGMRQSISANNRCSTAVAASNPGHFVSRSRSCNQGTGYGQTGRSTPLRCRSNASNTSTYITMSGSPNSSRSPTPVKYDTFMCSTTTTSYISSNNNDSPLTRRHPVNNSNLNNSLNNLNGSNSNLHWQSLPYASTTSSSQTPSPHDHFHQSAPSFFSLSLDSYSSHSDSSEADTSPPTSPTANSTSKTKSFWGSNTTSADGYYRPNPQMAYHNMYKGHSRYTSPYSTKSGKQQRFKGLPRFLAMMGLGLAIALCVKLSYSKNNHHNHTYTPAGGAHRMVARFLETVTTSTTTTTTTKATASTAPPQRTFRTVATRLHTKWTHLLVSTPHPVTTLDRLQDPTSPAHKALQWLIESTTAATASSSQEQSSSNAMRMTDHDIITQFSLATLYFATNGDQWTNQKGWLQHFDKSNSDDEEEEDMDVCHWHGIQCAHSQRNAHEIVQTITKIALPSNALRGTLPEELLAGLGHDVVTLNLGHNQLQGHLPESLVTAATKTKTFALRKLYIQDNAWAHDSIPQGLLGLKSLSV